MLQIIVFCTLILGCSLSKGYSEPKYVTFKYKLKAEIPASSTERLNLSSSKYSGANIENLHSVLEHLKED